MRILLRSGAHVDTSMKHGNLQDLLQDNNYDFVIVPDIFNDLKLYNIRKDAIDLIIIEEETNQ